MFLKNIVLDSQPGGSHLSIDAASFSKQSSRQEVKDLLFDASSLISTSLYIYRGLCPSSSPSFLWDELFPLPWRNDYIQNNGSAETDIPIGAEVSILVDKLASIGGDDFPSLDPAICYESAELKSDIRLQVQALIVEGLVAIDRFIDLMIHDKPYEALPWLSAAYKFQMDTLHDAWLIASRGNLAQRAGGAGGSARAAKLRPLKEWALEQDKIIPKGSARIRSRLLMKTIPVELCDLSVDPERIILETLKAKYAQKT